MALKRKREQKIEFTHTAHTHLSIDPKAAVSNPVGPPEEAGGLHIVPPLQKTLEQSWNNLTVKVQERGRPFCETTEPAG